jgi:hypothetical protein
MLIILFLGVVDSGDRECFSNSYQSGDEEENVKCVSGADFLRCLVAVIPFSC